MKRILQAIAVAAVATVPQSVLALDADLALDHFPSAARTAGGSVREWRDGGRDGERAGSVREYRHGGHGNRGGAFRTYGTGRDLGWRDNARYRPSGSFVDVRTLGGAVERGSFYGTAGTANSSFIVVGTPGPLDGIDSLVETGLRGGPKILDVSADRLDRRPYGKDGLAVAHVGTAKIIRISPEFRRGTGEAERDASDAHDNRPTPFAELRPEEQAVTVYPDTDLAERPVDPPAPRMAERARAPDVPAPAPATEEPAGFREPWTPEWLRDCVARYPSFDASLGTYVDAQGQRRFCTGEP